MAFIPYASPLLPPAARAGPRVLPRTPRCADTRCAGGRWVYGQSYAGKTTVTRHHRPPRRYGTGRRGIDHGTRLAHLLEKPRRSRPSHRNQMAIATRSFRRGHPMAAARKITPRRNHHLRLPRRRGSARAVKTSRQFARRPGESRRHRLLARMQGILPARQRPYRRPTHHRPRPHPRCCCRPPAIMGQASPVAGKRHPRRGVGNRRQHQHFTPSAPAQRGCLDASAVAAASHYWSAGFFPRREHRLRI